MNKIRYIATSLVFCLIVGGSAVWFAAKGADEVSDWERRKLAQFPEISYETLMSGEFMRNFETYVADQFPMRNAYRRLKAKVLFDVYAQKDNNGIYIADGHASEYKGDITDEQINTFCSRLNEIYDTFLKDTDCKVYYSIVPDKNYFLAEKNGYPAYDYDYVYSSIHSQLINMQEIEIRSRLTIDDYYTTDTHWRQEKIVGIANYMRNKMGMEAVNNYTEKSAGDFYGVYYGQSALSLDCDEIIYLTSDEIASSEVVVENSKTVPVYNLEKLEAMDHYDIYLSGAVSLLKITNPKGEEGKKLVVFRDSFGSSLTPLLVSGYSEITVIDTRYISPSYLAQFVEFTDQDVLFLYSTLLVSQSELLKK